MATADDLDPAQASRRASEGLQRAIESLDRHTEANAAATMEMALIQKKRASDIGLEELEPSALERKFVSMAGPGAKIGSSDPGQLNPDASEPPGSTEPLSLRTGQEQPPLSSTPGRSGGPQGIIPGVSQRQKESIEQEQYVVPQYGKFQVDAYLRMARKAAMAKAGETEPGSEEPNRWASVAGKLNTAVEKAPEYVAGYQAAKGYIKPILDIGFASSSMGSSLGYSPQAGTGINASHIAGIPNPIAAFSSPAAKQGLGSTVNALEQSLGGTGIGIGESNNLKNALVAQGWSNQREGGMFGFTEGGNQATLENTLAPLVKKGFNSPTSIEQLGEATNALKLGQATPEELKKTLEQLPEAAKILHKTLEEVTSGMEEFAAKSVENGSTLIGGMQKYGEVAKITGMNPNIIQGINQSSFGQVQAMSEGVKPWDIEDMTGPEKSVNAIKTLERLEKNTPTMYGTKKTNAIGEVETTSAEEEKYSYIHNMFGGPPVEQAKLLHAIAKKGPMVAAGENQAKVIGEEVVGLQQGNQKKLLEKGGGTEKEVIAHRHEQASIQQLKKEIANTRGEDLGEELFGGGNGGKKGELEERLRQTETSVKNRSNKIQSSLSSAKKDTGLTEEDQGDLYSKLAGPKGLYNTAEKAGVGAPELANIKKDKLAQQPGEITKALEKIDSVNIEKQNEENAKVELTGEAKRWFKLQFPKAKSPKETSNTGAKSTSSGATNVTGAGESAGSAAANKAQEELSRWEAKQKG
jgi:hypothetical protein